MKALSKKNILIVILSISINFLFAQAPTITSFNPASGSIGTIVTITGTNLNNLDTIKIGGVSAIKISAKTDTLIAMVMPGAITGSIYLKNSSGNVTSGSVFTKTSSVPPGRQQGGKLVGSGGSTIAYCSAVSVSADGNTAIVGGFGDNGGLGAAWIFIRNAGIWSQQGNKLVGTGNIGASQQGTAVSISADGNTAIIGGPNDSNNLGAAWIFTRSGTTWSQQGNKLVGSGSIGTTIFQSQSVSISADGNTAMIGSSWDNNYQGAVWVFTRSAGIWSQQGNKLTGSGATGSPYFGTSLCLAADGNSAIVGGPNDNSNQGAAWIFTRSGVVWNQQGSKLLGTGPTGAARQGTSVSLSADGNIALFGGINDNAGLGAAWVFNRSGTTWSQQGNKLVGTGSVGSSVYQGYAVSLSADGNTALIGGRNDNSNQGAAWVFNRIGTVWSQQGNKLVGIGNVGAAWQGYSVSLSADGNTAMIGGPQDNSNKGANWVFNGVAYSTNANINSLTISAGVLSPIFTPANLSYTANVSYNTTNITATTLLADTTARIKINVNGGAYLSVTSGNPSDTLSLNIGSNAINIKIIAQDTTIVKIYTITVTRTVPATITSFAPSSGYIGSLVTISGTNLDALDSIKIGGISAIKISSSATSLVAMVMPGAITGNIIISNASGNVTSSNTFTKINSIPPINQQGAKIGRAYDRYFSPTFGNSVSVSADGNTAIVGLAGDNNSQGAVYIYTRSGVIWSPQSSKLVGAGASNRGRSVAISADGNTAIVGAFTNNSINSTFGALIYIRIGGVWSQQGVFLVGTGMVMGTSIYQNIAVSISADGNTAIIGGSGDSYYQGAAWIFTRNAGVWSQQGSKLVGTGSSGIPYQGSSVSISADGNTAIVGGNGDNSNTGAVWVYTKNGNVWSQQGNKLVGTGNSGSSNQGYSVSLSADGNTAMVGGFSDSMQMGAVWVFARSGGIWRQQGNKILGSGGSDTAYQGISVSLSADGNTALIGGYKNNNTQGATWVFTRNDTVWSQNGNKLVGTGGTWNANQGGSVSISADGNTAMVGGPNDTSGQGAVWVFNGQFSNNANLNAISLSATSISPVFTVNTITYSATTSATATTFTAIRADTNASIQYRINGGIYITILSGNPSGLLLLNVGNNILNIKVTAQDGTTIKIYTVTINRLPSTIAKLSNINIIGTSYLPIFHSDTLAYAASVLFAVGNVKVSSILLDTSARIKIKINSGIFTNINNRDTSALLPLNVGINTIAIKVTAQDTAFTRTYLINITRAAAIAPSAMSYSSPTIIATRNITNINDSITYLGDAITGFSITPNLPSGVILNTLTGRISGTPSIVFPQTVFTITGINSSGSTTANFTLTVNSIAPTNLRYTDSIVIATRTITNINSSVTYSGDSIVSYSITPALPNGISLNTTTGLISGIPTGVFPQTVFTITGINSSGSTTASFRLTVNSIAPSNLKYSDSIVIATRTITNINSSVTYSGDSIASFSISPSLPTGVSLNITSGLISGTPTATLPQTIFTIIGTNNGGSTTASFRLIVNSIAPSNLKYTDSIVVATRTITNINSSVTYSGDSIASFSITPALPTGVSLNISTGLLSGIPTVSLPQTTFTITGTNNGGSTSANFKLTVNRIAPSNLKYSDSIVIATRTITNIINSATYSGDSITNFSVTPALPTGVSLNTTTGLISGIPTGVFPQTIFTITGINSSGSTTANFTLTVNRIAPSNLKYTDSIVVATRTINYINSSVTYSGDSITSFSITPALPNGVILNTLTGRISGIPTVAFPQTVFTITGINSSGSTTANFTLTVNNIAPTNLKYTDSIVVATRTITNINSSVTYSGDAIASFSITPALPNGVTLNTTTGLISGIPTVAILQTIYTVTGTNNGGSTTASFKLTVNNIAPSNLKYTDSIVIATRTITNINSSVTYSGDLINSFSITPALPVGVSLNTISGLISGISLVNLAQTIFTITGSNSAGNTIATFTLTVNPPLAIQEVNNPFSNINCKPNPFNHILEISFESNTKETTKLIITDAVGKEVFTKNIQSNIGNNNMMIDELTYLKSGIYFARLANDNGLSQAFKLVKE